MPWYQRWRNVFRSEKLNNELDDEFRYHLAETVDRLTAQGMTGEEARHQALLRLGNYSFQKESTRNMNIATWLDSTRADLLYGLRQLRRNPAFACVAVLSLALGIGANAAIFQLVNAIRLKTLPVKNPAELMVIDFENGAVRQGRWWSGATSTYPQWDEIRRNQQAFAEVMAWSNDRINLAPGGEPHYAQALHVSGGFFRGLGVNAVLGRTLNDSDDSSACSPAAVISYSFWQSEFGGDRSVLGRNLNLNGNAVPIVGVTPPSFFGVQVGTRYDFAIPLCAERLTDTDKMNRLTDKAGYWVSVMGRLKPGWTQSGATAHLHAISPSVMRATLPEAYHPDQANKYLVNRLSATDASSGVSDLRGNYERPLWLLMAITGLVLLISCANLANLLLARGAVRQPEIAMRLAVGASRWRLVRQFLSESMLLAIAGAVLGVAVALLLSRGLILLLSTSDNPLFIDMTFDWRLLAFTAAVATLTCLLFGLLPALRAAFLAPVTAVRAGVRVTAGRERFSFRRALVTIQVAFSLVLLFGALLFVRSLNNLMTVNPGFRPEGILTTGIDFSKTQYPEQQRLVIYHELRNRLSSIPGVVSVAQTSILPASGNSWDGTIGPDNDPAATGKDSLFNLVGPGYFKTMATPLLSGRDFNDRDTASSPKVAIVNEAFAHAFFGGANPVGHTFHTAADAGKPEPVFQIVGLVRDSKYHNLREPFQPIVNIAIAQSERPSPEAMFIVRIAGSPGSFISGARQTVAAMNPSIGIEFKEFSAQLQDSLLRERLMATLSGGFGLLAGVLATLGLYGVISYMVAQRRNEIGIRMALGASRANVVRMVLREASLLLCCGLAFGTVLSFWAGQAAAELLFGLQPHDATSMLSASVSLSIIALLASYLPARRAGLGDPMSALRSE
jgi:predicted permease